MDACEHEYESMSRHNRKVPSSFYYHFAQDACALSEKYARGRVVSVLEGGYSDRALISGAMAHMCGLVDLPSSLKIEEDWWSLENLIKVSTFLLITSTLTHDLMCCCSAREINEKTSRRQTFPRCLWFC